MTDQTLPLTGRYIALPESRELDLFAAMLVKRGAEVLRCPLVSIHDAPDQQPVLDWIVDFIACAACSALQSALVAACGTSLLPGLARYAS